MKILAALSLVALTIPASFAVSQAPAFEPQGLKPWQAAIVEEARRLYEPALRDNDNLPLEFEIIAESSSIVAGVRNTGSAYVVILYGGLLASPKMTPDGFRTVLCHELSHHFGGAPRRQPPIDWEGPTGPNGRSLTTSEAQADYASTQTCFRKMVRGQNHREHLTGPGLTPRLVRLCDATWGEGSDDSLICQRGSLGGYNMLRLVVDFPISFETPSDFVAPATESESYPLRQCRLDTYLAGALCRDDLPLILHATDARQSECSHAEGARPSCWYRR